MEMVETILEVIGLSRQKMLVASRGTVALYGLENVLGLAGLADGLALRLNKREQSRKNLRFPAYVDAIALAEIRMSGW